MAQEKDGKKLTYQMESPGMKMGKDGKLSGKMISPGEAWMNFVDSKDGHNAAAVTPSYLAGSVDKSRPSIDNVVQQKKNQIAESKLEMVNSTTNPSRDTQKQIEIERERY